MKKGVVSASSRSVVGDLDDLPTATVRLYQVQRPGEIGRASCRERV